MNSTFSYYSCTSSSTTYQCYSGQCVFQLCYHTVYCSSHLVHSWAVYGPVWTQRQNTLNGTIVLQWMGAGMYQSWMRLILWSWIFCSQGLPTTLGSLLKMDMVLTVQSSLGTFMTIPIFSPISFLLNYVSILVVIVDDSTIIHALAIQQSNNNNNSVRNKYFLQ